MFENLQGFTAVVLWEVALVSVCIFGDRCQRFFEGDPRMSAVSDNLIHGAIAFFSWAVFTGCVSIRRELMQCLGCAVLAMGLDVDHFLAAKSLTLKKALSLQNRPPFHNTTLIPFIAICLYLICRVMSSKASGSITLLFIVSWLSHHIRDGVRRGLWLWPFGSTPPIPFWMFIMLTTTLPLIFKTLRYLYQNSSVENEPFTHMTISV